MSENLLIQVWATYLGIGILFYVSAWKTQNMEYVTIANTALLAAAGAFIVDIIVAIRSK